MIATQGLGLDAFVSSSDYEIECPDIVAIGSRTKTIKNRGTIEDHRSAKVNPANERRNEMAATIQLHEMSALDAGGDKTSGIVRFKDADNAVVDLNNPLVIPAAGSIYSYSKKLRAYMEAPPDTQIGNLRWYTDGG